MALGKPHILVRQLKDLLCGLATIRVRAESITPIKGNMRPTSSRESGLRCPLVSTNLSRAACDGISKDVPQFRLGFPPGR